jgi:hypothetical protein
MPRAGLLALVLSLAIASGAQASPGLPFSFAWSGVAGAGGYLIEVADAQGDPVLSKKVGASARAETLSLRPGKYRLRMVTLNRFLRAEAASPWMAFRVGEAALPIETPRTSPVVQAPPIVQAPPPLPPALVPAEEPRVVLTPQPEPEPTLPPAIPPYAPNAAPAKKAASRHALLLSAGWSYGLPLADWASIYSATPKSAFLRADYSFKPVDPQASSRGVGLALGLESRYLGLDNSGNDGIVSSSLSVFSVALDPSIVWTLPFMSIRARAGVGLAYSSLDAASALEGAGSRIDSLDLLLMGATSLEIPIVSRMRLGFSGDYEYYLYSRGMDWFGASAYAAIDF